MIRKRGNTYITDFEVPGRGRVRVSLKTHDKDEAMRRAVLKYHELAGANPEPKLGDSPPMKAVLDAVYTAHWSKMSDTKERRAFILRVVSTFADACPTGSIGRDDIRQYRALLAAPPHSLSASTRNRYVSLLVAGLRYARDELGMPVAVPPTLKEREPAGRVRYLSTEGNPTLGEHPEGELGQLLEAETDFRWGILWRFLAESGARPDDALATEWRYIDFGQGTFYNPNSKVNYPQAVPLSAQLMAGLRALKTAGHPRPFRWSYWGLRHRFNKLKEAAGINDASVTAYTLRHTCATNLLQAGADIREVQTWLGHSNITTTERYAKVVPRRLFEIRQKLDDAAVRCAKSVPNPGTKPVTPTS